MKRKYWKIFGENIEEIKRLTKVAFEAFLPKKIEFEEKILE